MLLLLKSSKKYLAAGMLSSALMVGGAHAETRELKIYNWFEYLPKDVIEEFEKESGIKVTYDVFDSQEMLESKLMTGSSGYDLVFPSHSQIQKLIASQAIEPLDKKSLTNWNHLDPSLLKDLEVSDPGNQYSVPYLWGTTLIGYNVDKVKAVMGDDYKVDSWDMIFKKENIAKLQQCGVAFIDAPQEVLPIALNYLGINPNTKSSSDYVKARDLMMKIRPEILYINSSRFGYDLANGDICVAIAWSGAVSQAKAIAIAAKGNVHIEMAVPKEGTLLWSDDMAIPKSAKNVKEAHEFINYLLRPEVIAKVSNQVGYPNPNQDALPFTAPELLANKNLYVTPEVRNTLFVVAPADLKLGRVITREWSSVKNGTN
jgi:putrescine transport system substrate-binding protein